MRPDQTSARVVRLALRRALVLALLPAFALGAQGVAVDTTQPPAISLDQAIQLARRNAPQAVQARGQEKTARSEIRSAYGAFIPNVSLSVGAVRQFTGEGSRTRINPTTGATEVLPAQPWSYSNGLSFNAQLFDGGSRFQELKVARADVTAAEANTVAQSFSLALNVKQQFYAALAARESEDAARAQLAQAQAQLSSATARLRAGAATVSDSLRAEILVGNARLALLTARSSLRDANATLTRLIGSPTLISPSLSDTLDTVTPELAGNAAPASLSDSATLAALATNGPAVQQAQAALAAARSSRRASRAPYLPTVTAAYSRGGSGTDVGYGFGNDPFTYSGRLSLQLSYPLFNQFNRESQVARAEVAEANAEAALRDAELAGQQTLSQQIEALRLAGQRVAVQEATIRAAREDLRVQQQRYELGASTLLDVLTSQAQLNQAQAALIQARFDARVARARIEALIGRTLRPGGTP
jgi:outer membrane protein